jgi:hypothetical protein
MSIFFFSLFIKTFCQTPSLHTHHTAAYQTMMTATHSRQKSQADNRLQELGTIRGGG